VSYPLYVFNVASKRKGCCGKTRESVFLRQHVCFGLYVSYPCKLDRLGSETFPKVPLKEQQIRSSCRCLAGTIHLSNQEAETKYFRVRHHAGMLLRCSQDRSPPANRVVTDALGMAGLEYVHHWLLLPQRARNLPCSHKARTVAVKVFTHALQPCSFHSASRCKCLVTGWLRKTYKCLIYIGTCRPSCIPIYTHFSPHIRSREYADPTCHTHPDGPEDTEHQPKATVRA